MTSLGRKVIVVIFIAIFVGFICLLVFFNSKTSSATTPKIEDGNITHTDWLLDLSSLSSDCPICPEVTVRQYFCNPNNNVFVFRVIDVYDSSDDSKNRETGTLSAYQVSRLSEFKRFPDVQNTSIELDIMYSRSTVDCTQKLEKGTEYLVTAKLEDLSQEIVKNRLVKSFVISVCDVVIDWSSLSMPEKHAYYNFFTPKLSC